MGNSSQEGEECKIYGFTVPNGVIFKDKRDCRTFQIVKQFVHSWRHLKIIILFFNLFTLTIFMKVDNISIFLSKENLTINMQLLYFITTR